MGSLNAKGLQQIATCPSEVTLRYNEPGRRLSCISTQKFGVGLLTIQPVLPDIFTAYTTNTRGDGTARDHHQRVLERGNIVDQPWPGICAVNPGARPLVQLDSSCVQDVRLDGALSIACRLSKWYGRRDLCCPRGQGDRECLGVAEGMHLRS